MRERVVVLLKESMPYRDALTQREGMSKQVQVRESWCKLGASWVTKDTCEGIPSDYFNSSHYEWSPVRTTDGLDLEPAMKIIKNTSSKFS